MKGGEFLDKLNDC